MCRNVKLGLRFRKMVEMIFMKASVCIATYNGLEWIEEQVSSILKQTNEVFEIVIVDDHSSDGTFEYLESLNNPIIKVFRNHENLGVIQSFEKALDQSSGDIVFLCDQDDIWHENKIEKVLEIFQENPDLKIVVHDAVLIDGQNKSLGSNFYSTRKFSDSLIKNLLKNRFHGCCMAIEKKFLKNCIPFPENIPMHDWWIGVLGCQKNKVQFIEDPLIKYRKHGNNLTGKSGSLWQQIKWRFSLTTNLLKCLRKN